MPITVLSSAAPETRIEEEFAARYSARSSACFRRPPFAHSCATLSSARVCLSWLRTPAAPEQPRARSALIESDSVAAADVIGMQPTMQPSAATAMNRLPADFERAAANDAMNDFTRTTWRFQLLERAL